MTWQAFINCIEPLYYQCTEKFLYSERSSANDSQLRRNDFEIRSARAHDPESRTSLARQ
jgi:hypothetical protein